MLRKPLVKEGTRIFELPDGDTIDVAGQPVESAQRLEASFTAGETISALRLFYIDSNGQAYLGDPTSYLTSQVVGISLTAAVSGQSFTGLLFGKLDDAFFNFASKVPIFLGAGGTLTATIPVSGTRTKVGQGLFVGSIFLKIEDPIQLS